MSDVARAASLANSPCRDGMFPGLTRSRRGLLFAVGSAAGATAAYILASGQVITPSEILDAATLPRVRMPNHDGFIPDPRPVPPTNASH